MTKVAIGSDHAGFQLKEFLSVELSRREFEVLDVGIFSLEPADYPRYCIAAAEAVTRGDAVWGIVLGEVVKANKWQRINYWRASCSL